MGFKFNPVSGELNYFVTGGGGGSSTWGSITGTLSSQTDLQTALDGKVSVLTTPINSVYTVSGTGTQAQIVYASNATAGTIVYRTTNGVTSVGTPTSAAHATTKTYVDTADALKQNTLTLTTTGTTGAATLVGATLNIPNYASGGGTGDVVGAASSVDNTIVRFDGTTGKVIQGTGLSIDDNDNIILIDSLTNGNIVAGTTNGTQIATASTQKLGFFGATPVVRQSATGDLGAVLSNLGFRTAGTSYPISTSGNVAFTGSMRLGLVTITTATTLAITNSEYRAADATAGAFNVTLPATTTTGYRFTIKKIDATANAVTILGTIDGVTNYVLSTQWKYVTLVSTVTSGVWYIVGNN